MIPIKGFEGFYSLDEKGNIFSHPRNGTKKNGQFVKCHVDIKGYYYIYLAVHGKRYPKRLHRLLGEHFIPNSNNEYCINHKDGNKLNNSLDNLEWCSLAYNTQHEFRTGLAKPICLRGKDNPNTILTPTKVRAIRKLIKYEGISLRAIGRKYGVSVNTIINIKNKITWNHIV